MKRILIFLWALALTVSLAGCASFSFIPDVSGEIPDLPQPSDQIPEAPQGDATADRTVRITLQYVGEEQQLVPVSRTVRLNNGDSLVGEAVRRLLEEPGVRDVMRIAPEGTQLLWSEHSQNVLTVNLSSEALNLSAQELVEMRAAVANTLCGLGNVDYVNVLIGGQDESALSLPTGTLSQTDGNLAALWAQRLADEERVNAGSDGTVQLERDVTLYFSAPGSDYLLPEVRHVRFSSDNYALQVVNELALGSQTARDVLPREGQMLTSAPHIETLEDGRRVILLNFDGMLPSLMERDGLSFGRLYAALTLTLCRFVPEIDALMVQVGGVAVESVVLDGREILFEQGIMSPEQFEGCVGRMARLYFANEQGGLSAVERTMDLAGAVSARALLEALIDGPVAGEESVRDVMPDGISHADILGIRLEENVALVNLSSNFYRCCQSMGREEERNLIYAMVNTLAGLDNVAKVRFYVEGQAIDTLAEYIYLRGELLPNWGIVRQG